jgi:hypothetical protein
MPGTLVALYASTLEPELSAVGYSPGRKQRGVAFEHAAGIEQDALAAAELLERDRLRLEHHRDALLAKLARDVLAQVFIELGHQPEPALHDRYFRAERSQHARQLERDVTAADEHDLRRPLRQNEHVVRGERVLLTGNLRHERARACRDHHVLAVQRLPVDCDGAYTRDACRSPHELDAGLLQVALVDRPESIGLAAHGREQRGPGMRCDAGRRKAVLRRVLERACVLRRIYEQLLRHAAGMHTGPPDLGFLNQRDARAVCGSDPRRPHAAATTADDD